MSNKMPETMKEQIVGLYNKGLRPSQIAQTASCPISTVYNNLKRAGIKLERAYPPGPTNPNWQGGITIKNGYKYVRQPEHPRAHQNGYVAEHILNWEEANNKPVPDNWVVHHINGVKDDNRPENLTVLPRDKHHFYIELYKVQQQLIDYQNDTAQTISKIWDAVFNHIPSQLRWQNVKLNFILGFMGLVLALLAVIILT